MGELNIITNTIEVNGKKYKLQHPGNREWIRLKKTIYDLTGTGASFNVEPLLDYFFEHCCFPETGDKLTIDNVPLRELEEVWVHVAQRFLRGELEPGFVHKDKKSLRR